MPKQSCSSIAISRTPGGHLSLFAFQSGTSLNSSSLERSVMGNILLHVCGGGLHRAAPNPEPALGSAGLHPAQAAGRHRDKACRFSPRGSRSCSYLQCHLQTSGGQRSISPNTMSSEPMIAATSASICPRLKKSIACRCANDGARILHL